MRHAALRVHEQHMIWQQTFIEMRIRSGSSICQKKTITKFRCVECKKVINEKGLFFYGLAAAGFLAGAAPGGKINVVVLMESSFSKFLSR